MPWSESKDCKYQQLLSGVWIPGVSQHRPLSHEKLPDTDPRQSPSPTRPWTRLDSPREASQGIPPSCHQRLLWNDLNRKCYQMPRGEWRLPGPPADPQGQEGQSPGVLTDPERMFSPCGAGELTGHLSSATSGALAAFTQSRSPRKPAQKRRGAAPYPLCHPGGGKSSSRARGPAGLCSRY